MNTPSAAQLPYSRTYSQMFRLLLSIWAMLFATGASGIPAELRLDELHHTRWTIVDGAPAYAHAMAQSSDGALWIGTDHGLYRFDGVQFQRIHRPNPVAAPSAMSRR